MIKVQDWMASIPDEEKHVAYVGEGKCVKKEFLLCGDGWEEYKHWTFFLDMTFDAESITTRDSRQVVSTRINRSEIDEVTGVTADETVFKETYTVHDEDVLDYDLTDIASLTKSVGEDGLHLTWTVLRQHTVLPGKLWATLRAVSGEIDEVKKSDIMVFEVDAAVNARPATVPAVSTMEQMVQQTAAAKDDAVAAKEFAESAATGANRAAADALNCQFICENYAELTKERWQETVTSAATAEAAAQRAEEAADAVGGIAEFDTRVNAVEATLYGVTDSDPEVETVTVTNLITNPQFADGTSGWSMASGSGVDLSVEDGVLCVTQTAPTYNYNTLRHSLPKAQFVIGNKYYMLAKIKFEGKLSSKARIDYTSHALRGGSSSNDLTTGIVYTSPVLGEWCYMSSIVDFVTTPTSAMYIGILNAYTDFSTSEIVGSKYYLDNVVCIDLTAAFGAGNEPDLATMDGWMQEQYAHGFEGTTALALTYADDGDGSDGLVGAVAVLENDVVKLQDDVAALAEAVENLPATDVAQTGTVYPALHDYYIANMEEARPEYYNAQEPNTLTFAMLADMHVSPAGGVALNNVEASSAWAKLVNHDFVVLGGDFLNDPRMPDKATALSVIGTVMEMAEKHAVCPVFAVKGNHDTNELSAGNENRLTDEEFYRHANARGEKYGMVTDPDHPYGGYYYVDFPRHKIRMVCLNTSENYPDVDLTDPNVGDRDFRYIGVFSENQMAWIKDTALRVDKGWAVMMVSHISPILAENFDNRGTDNPDLHELCEAFAAGTVPFAEQGAREFIGHFNGHAHVDAYNNVGGLNYVNVNCTFPHKYKDSAPFIDRTANEDKLSLNSFIVDRATRTVKCIKIGAAPADDYDGWVDSFTW